MFPPVLLSLAAIRSRSFSKLSMQPELFSRWTLPISQPSWRRCQRRRKRASSNFTKLLIISTARSPTRSGSARERTILEQTAGGLETMELLGTNQKTGKYTNILLLMATQIFLAAVGWAQAISLPEPPQVRAKNHVVSLTLHAVRSEERRVGKECRSRWWPYE